MTAEEMKKIEIRTMKEALFVIENKATVRMTAKKFGISKTTVHKDLSERLPTLSIVFTNEVNKIFENNKAERHIRGGLKTKAKYKNGYLRKTKSP